MTSSKGFSKLDNDLLNEAYSGNQGQVALLVVKAMK